ncbi:hypothetical protein MUG78_08720 [Gordonia alkaliphila]|uniref:hypothetical protein n=1 Tax=Gordonia alkaliphila TaxID=1053547 RepID=UPI001FF66B9E|nr:hypothetical protein [Gordonia alkaliphila]MCK0439544.1 hypothetical protein [Gordonia alkaliphila]
MTDTGPQPRPELETVAGHDDLDTFGVPVDVDEIDATITLEREFLTALVWAPPSTAAAIVHALIGPDRLPVDAPLFYLPDHGTVFRRLAGAVAEGTPVSATDLVTAFDLTEHDDRFAHLLMEIASPNPLHPWPLPTEADLPALARSLADQWLRRGYQALLARMHTVLREERTSTLDQHWLALSRHQRAAQDVHDRILTALDAPLGHGGDCPTSAI